MLWLPDIRESNFTVILVILLLFFSQPLWGHQALDLPDREIAHFKLVSILLCRKRQPPENTLKHGKIWKDNKRVKITAAGEAHAVTEVKSRFLGTILWHWQVLSSPIIIIVNPDCNRGGQVAAGGQRTAEGWITRQRLVQLLELLCPLCCILRLRSGASASECFRFIVGAVIAFPLVCLVECVFHSVRLQRVEDCSRRCHRRGNGFNTGGSASGPSGTPASHREDL